MAYRDKTGALLLTPAEQHAALTECIYGNGEPHLKTWDQLDEQHRRDTIRAYLRKHPERLPLDSNELPGAKSGLTQSQLEYIASVIFEPLADRLPEMVKVCVEQMVELDWGDSEEKLRRQFSTMVDRLKGVDLKLLESKIAEVARGIETKQQSAPNDRDASVIESLERRASRQGDHLQRLEDRIRKLEGKA